jgi:hypothetical protein
MSLEMGYNRIHASFDESTLAQIDQEAEKQGTSRGKWLADAVGSYLSLLGLTEGSDPAQVTLEGAQLRLNNKRLEEEVQKLKESEKSANGEAAHVKEELVQLRLTNESQWKESQKLKKAEESSREEAAQLGLKLKKLEAQVSATVPELETLRNDMSRATLKEAHFVETLKLKDQEIAFLQAHVAQLTQTIGQIALKPGEEEIKKKGWWQFWK